MTETTNNILGENMLPLAEIAKPVFNITPRIAQQPTFRGRLTIPEVSLISGHTSWESLKRYTHIQPKHVLEKLAKPR